jgi:ribosomal-protein-alanine N-acetyltransferase
MTVPSPPTQIRQLGPFDLDLLAAMHARCFAAAWDQPWSAASFAEILAMPGAGGYLISDGEQPLGFAITRSVIDEMEVLLIATDPDRRQRGLGGTLLDTVLEAASRTGVRTVFLEYAAANLAAGHLYASRGFAKVGERRGYYHGPGGEVADALILRLDTKST